ncbi:MAG TPA: SPOR domain-containing protein [Rhizomicrobium sp.]|nr:SPOR domain-containing protein [Rhizomicrobium sp.]
MERTNRPKRRFPAKTVVLAAILAGLSLAALAYPAEAASRRHKTAATARITPMPAGATDPSKDAALIIDGSTGKVLFARNELLERHPASLTKMMTLYLLFDALKNGKIAMQTQMPVSVHAQQQKPTKLSLRHGQTIDVDTAIRAIVIRSANDVAVVIAEALGGTESHFAEMMNDKARQLGMKETNYHNASGLPDPLQITTAMDLGVLARHLAYDFPQYYPYFGTLGFTYKGTFYPTHDNLVGRYPGADGIKTGYVGASGFNLASSVVRDGVHLIGIVMGGRTAVRRDLEMMHLMDTEFAAIGTNPTLVARGQVPWMTVAQAAFAPPPPGFVVAPVTGNNNTQFASLSAVPTPLAADADEDTAEAHRAPDEDYATLKAEAPQLASAATPPQPVPASSVPVAPGPAPDAPMPKPLQTAIATPAPDPGQTKPQQVAVAASHPAAPKALAAVPAIRPKSAGEGDQDQPAGLTWTIQVGAYADQALARAQLNNYAAKAKDIIGEASHIVAPIQSANGHVIYRARFGPYAEREAREVCSQLTQRGQSCFAVVTR